MAQRQYESATVFNCRNVDMRHLWTPSTEYKGKKTEKPNYFGMFIVQKTVPQWFNEPALAGIAAACGKIYQNAPHVVTWPVIDGDLPSPEGKISDFAKGHWLFSASTGNPPNIEVVQAGGQLVKLPNRVGVKPGDYCMVGVTAAVKQNDPRGVKLYLNAVVFSSPGEEIVFANSVSGAELMRMAEQQGLRPAGFSGFGGAPQGFGTSPQNVGGFGGTPQGGFTPGSPPNGQPQGFAPGNPAPGAFGGAPAPGGAFNAPNGNATSPFNGGAPQPGPGQFQPPFPGR
ncbi:MAG: ssDNA-binding protein [Planctomycetota bacterium]